MATFEKRVTFVMIITALFFIGSTGWPLLSCAPAPVAIYNSSETAAKTLVVLSASVKEGDGLPALAIDGRDAMTVSNAFWSNNWSWDNLSDSLRC